MTATKARTNGGELIERLARIEASTPSVVSCYLRLDRAARTNRAYLVGLTNRIRTLRGSLESRGIDTRTRERITADTERIVRWLSRPGNLPELPGLALFAASELDLFESVPLARVHRDRIDVDTRPLLHELLDAQETLGHYLAVAVDRSRARFFHVTATRTEELSGLAPIARRGGRFRADRRDAPGWGEHQYHQRIATEKHRHYAAIAAELVRLTRARPYRGLVLLGPDTHTTALVEFFPNRVRELLQGAARLNPTSVTPAEVGRATWQLQGQAERRAETELLDQVEQNLATGWAVNGLRETLRALGRGQVRELIVPAAESVSGFRCRGSGLLVASKADCRGDGQPVPIPHLVDHAIEDTLRQGGSVTVIDDPDAAARISGLAATLRFRSK